VPQGGRVNAHLRFVHGAAVPATREAVWAGVMRYEVISRANAATGADELVAEPIEMSFWGPWDEVQIYAYIAIYNTICI